MLITAFRLASHLGKTVGELQRGMTMREFVHWCAFLKLEPPDEGDNMRTASLLATITNMAGRSLPGKKTVEPKDFFQREKPRQTAAQQLAFMKTLKGSANG
jgi:hypothetical protein